MPRGGSRPNTGGARPGSGRKRGKNADGTEKEPTEPYSIRLPLSVIAWLETQEGRKTAQDAITALYARAYHEAGHAAAAKLIPMPTPTRDQIETPDIRSTVQDWPTEVEDTPTT